MDIETIGKFDGRYRYSNDSREYQYIQQVIFGYIDTDSLHILYVRQKSDIGELNERVAVVVNGLRRPLYAFNTCFEKAVLFHGLGQELFFGGELQGEPFEAKATAVTHLGISNYDDPFFDRGILCMKAWECGQFEMAIAHNRACLLKERDILVRRGFRAPDEMVLFR